MGASGVAGQPHDVELEKVDDPHRGLGLQPARPAKVQGVEQVMLDLMKGGEHEGHAQHARHRRNVIEIVERQ